MDLGYERKRYDSVSFDKADIAKRQKMPHVIALAKSRKTVALAPPVLNKTTGRVFVLLAGRDRIAADLLNEETMGWFKVVQTDAMGAKRVEREENLRRRNDDRDKLIAEEVEETKKSIVAQDAKVAKETKPDTVSEKSKAPVGRPKTVETKAREAVAEKLKTTPDAIRKATERAAKADKPAKPAKPPVEAHGVALSPAFIGVVTAIQGHLDDVDRHLKAAQAAMSRLPGPHHHGTLPAVIAEATKAVHDIAARVRAQRPVSVCLSCKDPDGKEGRLDKCPACLGAGWITVSATKDVPAELKATDAVSNGKGGITKPPEKKLNIVLEA